MTFITFYTPTYKRPNLLAICRKSVQDQEHDYQHMMIVDDTGIGVAGMFRDIRRHTDRVRGEYVFILADDDRLIGDLAVVRDFARAHDNPPVIILKNHKWGQTFPLIWESASDPRPEPVLGKIDTGNFIIRADVFRETAHLFGLRYEGDFDYIHALWERGYPFAWLDHEFSEMQLGGKGRTEEELMAAGHSIHARCIRSFVAMVGGKKFNVSIGQEITMPPGVDWARAGLVVALESEIPAEPVETAVPFETATLPPVERAVGKRERRKK